MLDLLDFLEKNRISEVKKVREPGLGFSIAGMILGIIAFLMVFSEFDSFEELSSVVFDLDDVGVYFFGMIGFFSADILFVVLSLVFSIIGYQKSKNGFNIAGIILSGISALILVSLIFFLFVYYL